MFGGSLISYKSKKHECIAQSSMEAYYFVVILAIEEVLFLIIFFKIIIGETYYWVTTIRKFFLVSPEGQTLKENATIYEKN